MLGIKGGLLGGRGNSQISFFLSLFPSFSLWFVLSTFVFTLLCSLSCPPSSPLHFFSSFYISPSILPPCGAKAIGFHHHSAPILINSIFSLCQKWFFHFQSTALHSSILILQMLTLSFKCQDKYNF